MSRWINFIEILPLGRPRKTKAWEIRAKRGGVLLGAVEWFAEWRKYCFWPGEDTIFDEQCLRDIAAFCEQQTKARRRAAQAEMNARNKSKAEEVTET